MFSLPSAENACGLFTPAHIISSTICIVIVIALAILLRSISDKVLKLLTRVLSIIISVLEVIKITFKLIIGEGAYIDHYLPLFYCSLFIYALFMCGFGKGIIYKIGCTFLQAGCVFAGLIFLIYPTTSLPDYPVYHFVSIYSAIFHSSMALLGFLYLRKQYVKFDKISYFYYVIFVSVPIVISLILNPICKSNLMLIDNPVNIPVAFIKAIYEFSPFLYTACTCLLYLSIPYFFTLGVYALCKIIKSKFTL